MRIAVTGSNGLVGSRVARTLAAQGHEVLGLSRGERTAHGAFAFQSLDLASEAQVTSALESFVPEAIVHPASMTEVDACEKDPVRAYAANVTAAANVARAARATGAHLVHVSTDYVFDGDAGPYDELARPNPRGTYAVTKFLGEEAVKLLAPSFTIARTAVVYGWPAAARPNFGAWLVGAFRAGGPVKLFNDQFVSPSLADNVADMLCELTVRRLPGVYNVCGAEIIDRVRFGQRLCAVFGFDPAQIVPVKLAELKLPSPRPLRSGLVVDKVRAALTVQPLDIDESLRRFHAAWQRVQASAA